jgi:hypothetical protein
MNNNNILSILKQSLSILKIEIKKVTEKRIKGKHLYDRYETMKILNISPYTLKSLRIEGRVKYLQQGSRAKILYEVTSVYDLFKQLKK